VPTKRSAYPFCQGDLGAMPSCVRVSRDVYVQDAPALERQNEEDVEHVETHRWNGQKIDRERAGNVHAKERSPGRGLWSARSTVALGHVLRDCVLAHVVPELGEFARDPAPTPQRIFHGHAFDQGGQLRADRRTAEMR
jgi:hypothetical protein